MPTLVAALAIPTYVAFWIGGDPRAGVIGGSLSIVFALVLALGGRSDTICAERTTTSGRSSSRPARRR